MAIERKGALVLLHVQVGGGVTHTAQLSPAAARDVADDLRRAAEQA